MLTIKNGPAAALLASLSVIASLLGGCGAPTSEGRATPRAAAPVPVMLLPLPDALDDAELSGLTWYGAWLVLLPQNPGQFAPPEAQPGEGRVFALHRDSLLAALDAKTPGRQKRLLRPRAVPFLAPGVAEATPGFDGYEALAFRGDTVFVTIETGHGAANMQGFAAWGRAAGHLDTLRLDTYAMTALPPQAGIANFSYEALVAGPRDVLALYESNGAARNPTPQAARFSFAMQALTALSFPRLEYRVTDATAPDAQGRFWVLNDYWPGDSTRLQPRTDALSPPSTETQSLNKRRVERVVELRRTGDSLALSGHAPIRLQLDGSGQSRNWEGLARLGTRGFLLATDEYPRTMLGFVPRPARAASARSAPRFPWMEPVETGFFILGGLVLAVLALLAARYPGNAWRFTRERFQRGTAYGLSLTVAALFVGGAFWAFTEIVEAWTGTASLFQLDAAADRLAQAWAAPGVHAFMLGATWLGSGWAASLIVGVVSFWLYRRGERREPAVLVAGFGAGEALVYGLKILFHRARPSGGLSALGDSFPSGHAFTALLTYGLLAYLLWQVPTLRRGRYGGAALAVFAVLLVGASRIYLRAHYLTDVAGGYVLGAGWLVAWLALTSVLRTRRGRTPFP